jgi:glucosamine-6-phosphate deaminase
MKLIVADNYEDLSRKALKLIDEWARACAAPSIVLPTGNTPLGLYRLLAGGAMPESLARARFILLDEYQGIARDDPRTLGGWLTRTLFGPLAIAANRIIHFDPAAVDCEAEAARVESAVLAQGIDIAILGLGPNGHVGFNEPGSSFTSATRLVELTPESVTSNARYWGSEEQVPRRGFTLGIGTLARARRSMLLVNGEHKSAILANLLEGAASPDLPATYLLGDANAVVIADRASLSQVDVDVA